MSLPIQDPDPPTGGPGPAPRSRLARRHGVDGLAFSSFSGIASPVPGVGRETLPMPKPRRPQHEAGGAIPLIQIDRAVFRVCPPDFELLLYTHRPGRSLVDALERGPVELALVVEEPAILILARF